MATLIFPPQPRRRSGSVRASRAIFGGPPKILSQTISLFPRLPARAQAVQSDAGLNCGPVRVVGGKSILLVRWVESRLRFVACRL